MKPATPTPADGVAWITGASSGIGYELAKALAAEGWTVAVSARSADKLQALAEETGGKAAVFPVDMQDADAVQATVAAIEAAHGPIALAVLNAGIYLPVNAEAPDFSVFKRTFDVNILGTAAALTALNPRMAGRRKGHIALVSSATGFGGMPTASAYGASKAALTNMAECLHIELKRWGVKVQVITPGFVETPAQDDNEFPKPFMISAQKAAGFIQKGLKRDTFEVTFPKQFTLMLKAIYALPKNWYLSLVAKQTGWAKPLASDATPGAPVTDSSA